MGLGGHSELGTAESPLKAVSAAHVIISSRLRSGFPRRYYCQRARRYSVQLIPSSPCTPSFSCPCDCCRRVRHPKSTRYQAKLHPPCLTYLPYPSVSFPRPVRQTAATAAAPEASPSPDQVSASAITPSVSFSCLAAATYLS